LTCTCPAINKAWARSREGARPRSTISTSIRNFPGVLVPELSGKRDAE